MRFLTVKTNEPSAKIERAILDFTKQRPNTEFRIDVEPSDLHDRYVLTNDSLLILGHGLKDIGSKESFMISLRRDNAGLLDTLATSFDDRWNKAAPVI